MVSPNLASKAPAGASGSMGDMPPIMMTHKSKHPSALRRFAWTCALAIAAGRGPRSIADATRARAPHFHDREGALSASLAWVL